jgi:hypothetical protein
MKIPNIIKLNLPELLQATTDLPLSGKLMKSANNLVYLDVDDDYVHRLFPLLIQKLPENFSGIKKPDYFGKGSAGAHVSVIYPEENKVIQLKDLNQVHHFKIKEFVAADIGAKKYFVLLVESESLLALRRKYGLSDLLCFKGYGIGFHVTVGTKSLVF